MAVTVTVNVDVQPESVEELIGILKETLADTRAYEGNIGIELYQNQADPNNLILIEEWQTRANHEAYLAWRTETGLMETVGKMLAGPPDIRYFDHIAT